MMAVFHEHAEQNGVFIKLKYKYEPRPEQLMREK
jgi:hypothetical protein